MPTQNALDIAEALRLREAAVRAESRTEAQASEKLLRELSDMFNSTEAEQDAAVQKAEAFRRGEGE